MSLNILLEAADFIDRGEATTSVSMSPNGRSKVAPAQSKPAQKPLYKTIWSRSDEDSNFFREFEGEGDSLRRGTREVHNKLEKNRRAHLKECFEVIKRQLLPGQDNKKSSHLSILHNAIKYIQVLRRKDREYEHEMERLAREKIGLQQRVAQLKRELTARWDHLDVNALLLEEPEEITIEDDGPEEKYSATAGFAEANNIPSDGPKMISITSRLEPVKTTKTTALISPVQLVTSSNVRVLSREPSPGENGKGRFLTLSGGAFQAGKFKAAHQPSGFTHVVAPMATSHGTLITPVTVVSQGTQIAQIITAPSSKLVAPFNMKPVMSQYLVKHGSAVVVRNQASARSQTSSK